MVIGSRAARSRAGVLAPDISKHRGIATDTFQRVTGFRQPPALPPCCSPTITGRLMCPEEKVIPKTDFDLPIATCCSTLRSWQGSVALSSRNTTYGKLQHWWHPRKQSSIATFNEQIVVSRTCNVWSCYRFCRTKMWRLVTGFKFHEMPRGEDRSRCSGTNMEVEFRKCNGCFIFVNRLTTRKQVVSAS